MKQIITTLLFLFLMSLFAFGQQPEQDCENAIPVCIGIYFQENSYVGEGFVENEINSETSCMDSGEKNDVWYKFSIVTSGDLGFSITPNNLDDDYDWAVYNVSELRCFDIFDNPSMEVSCNWSGTDGLTGATGPPYTTSSEGAGGPNQNAFIPVSAGEQYMLNVSNYSDTQDGYTLDLTLSTAQVTGPLQEVDLLNVSAIPGDTINPVCGSTELVVFFDVLLDCDLIYGEGIVLEDDNGNQYAVTNVESDCESIAGGLFSDWFTLTLDQPLEPGSYQLTVNNDDDMPVLVDICGNKAINADSDTLTAEFAVIDLGDAFNFTAFPVDCQGGSDGTLIVSTTTGSNFDVEMFDINWSNGATGSFVNGVPAGIYTVEVGTGSCIVMDTLEVTETFEFSGTALNISTLEVCQGVTATIEANALDGNNTFVWNGPGGFTSTDLSLSLNDPDEGTYSLVIENENGCTITESIEVSVIECTDTTGTGGAGGTDSTGTGSNDWATGIAPVSLEQVRIYPNPANNILNIESNLNLEDQMVQVYDVYGKRMARLPINTSLVLDINEWNSGMYFIHICGKDQKEELVFKIIKE